jgi:hypothetical protein
LVSIAWYKRTRNSVPAGSGGRCCAGVADGSCGSVFDGLGSGFIFTWVGAVEQADSPNRATVANKMEWRSVITVLEERLFATG